MNLVSHDTQSKKTTIDWELVLTLLGFLLGSGILFTIWQWYIESQPPSFTVRAINTLAGNNVYEITNHLIWGTASDPITITWGIETIPNYRGKKSYGEVRVLLKELI
jgi:hypothetical protein